MSVAFYGTQEVVLSFEALDVTEGYPVVMKGDHTVSDAGGAEKPIGIALHTRNGIAGVQLKGYVELPYSGAEPMPGWESFVADGSGGVKAEAGGLSCFVVHVDEAAKSVGLYL